MIYDLVKFAEVFEEFKKNAKEAILKSMSKNNYKYFIFFNLIKSEKIIDIELIENKNYFPCLILDQGSGPNDKKIFVTTVSLNLLNSSLPDLITYNKFNDFKIKESRLKELKEKWLRIKKYLEPYFNEFYIKENEKGYVLNFDLFNWDSIYLDTDNKNKILSEIKEKIKKNEKAKNILGIIERFIVNKLKKRDKHISNRDIAYGFKFDGNSIYNLYHNDYLDILYFHKVEKSFFNKEGYHKKGICYICRKEDEISSNINIPTKFYITGKKGFFYNLNKKNAVSAFSICYDCYKKLIFSSNYILNYFNYYLYGQTFVVIPTSDLNNITSETYRELKEVFEEETLSGRWKVKKDFMNDLLKSYTLLKESGIKYYLIFYQKGNQDWKIIKSIDNVYIVNHIKFHKKLRQLNKKISKLFENSPKQYIAFNTLNQIVSIIFDGTFEIKRSNDFSYTRYMIELIEGILKTNYFNFWNLFEFKSKTLYFHLLNSFKGKKNREEKKNPYWFSYLKLFYLKKLFENLNEGEKMKTKYEILNRFFEEFSFKDIEKALIVVGFIAGKISELQRNQEKKSNFLSKINYEGMDLNEIINFINEEDEYLEIYHDKLRYLNDYELKAWAKSIIIKEKIDALKAVFYILLGVDLAKIHSKKDSLDKGGEDNE